MTLLEQQPSALAPLPMDDAKGNAVENAAGGSETLASARESRTDESGCGQDTGFGFSQPSLQWHLRYWAASYRPVRPRCWCTRAT